MSAPRALVLSESMFGNTGRVAAVVAAALRKHGLEVVEAAASQPPPAGVAGYDLVVVGGPTHAFSLSRPSTRTDAVRQGARAEAAAPGLREWIEALPDAPAVDPPVPVAVFDTRVTKVRRLPKSAGTRASTLLRRKGYRLVGRAEGFCVEDVSGPLAPGEEERAAAWARTLADDLSVPVPGPGPGRH